MTMRRILTNMVCRIDDTKTALLFHLMVLLNSSCGKNTLGRLHSSRVSLKENVRT